MTTFDDDFVRIRITQGMQVNLTLRSLGLEWPPPLRIGVRTNDDLGFRCLVAFDVDHNQLQPDDVVYHRVSCSEIDDEDRADMTHVARGAFYAHAIVTEARP